MQNPFKKKPKVVPYKELPTPVEKLKRLEKALTRMIEYNGSANWAVKFLIDIQEIRAELEKESSVSSHQEIPYCSMYPGKLQRNGS